MMPADTALMRMSAVPVSDVAHSAAAVHIWMVRPDGGDMGLLSDAERERVARIASPTQRKRLIARRTAIRRILAALVGTDPAEPILERRCERCGRHHPVPLPQTGGTPLFWSSSSAADLLVVATGVRQLGVDVEPVDRTGAWAAVARRYFTTPEVAAIGPSAWRFADFWTLKEALLKAQGVGVLGGLDRLCCTTLGRDTGGWLATPDHPQWKLRRLTVAPGIACALAVDAPPDVPGALVETMWFTIPGREASCPPHSGPGADR